MYCSGKAIFQWSPMTCFPLKLSIYESYQSSSIRCPKASGTWLNSAFSSSITLVYESSIHFFFYLSYMYPDTLDMFILYRVLKSLNLFLLVFLLIFSHLLHWRSLYCMLFTSCLRCALNLWLALITWYGCTSKHSFNFWIEHGLINFFLGSWWYVYIFNIDPWAR